MTCEEVKALLTDYLDKSLDTPTTTRVATHLISCTPCGAEAGDLTECISQVAALPELDPPLGFAQRVMAHVRELEPKPTLWERLFLPWTKKLPLQATALVMIGIVGVFLYQKDDALKYSDRSETALRAALVPPTEEIKSQPVTAAPTPPEQLEKPAVKPTLKPSQQVHRAQETIAATSPSRDQSAAPKSELEVRQEEKVVFKRPTIPAQGASNPSEAGRLSGGAGFAPAMPLGGLRQSAPRPAPMALERAIPLGERVADYEFVVRRRPSPRREMADAASPGFELKALEMDSAARLAAPPPAAPSIESIAEIRFYHVAPEHFEYFKKELANEALVESEAKTAKEKESAGFDRRLLVKVTILPAAPESAAPPR
jgi:hypothetical protein